MGVSVMVIVCFGVVFELKIRNSRRSGIVAELGHVVARAAIL